MLAFMWQNWWKRSLSKSLVQFSTERTILVPTVQKLALSLPA